MISNDAKRVVMRILIRKYMEEESGSIIEYCIIGVLVAVVAVVAIIAIGTKIAPFFQSVANGF